VVKPLIEKFPDDWLREILLIGDPGYVRLMEELRLNSLDAKNDPMSYNEDNADGKFSTTGKPVSNETRLKLKIANTGKKRSEESKKNYRKANQKKAKDPIFRKNLSISLTGIPKSTEHRAALSAAKIGSSSPIAGRIGAINLLTGKNIFVIPDDPGFLDGTLKVGWDIVGSTKDRVAARIKVTGERVMVYPTDPGLISGDLSLGWGPPNDTIICDYCGFQGCSSSAMKRWHGDNCTQNPNSPRFNIKK